MGQAQQAQTTAAPQDATSQLQRPFSNPKLTHKAGWIYLFRRGMGG
jgi:hypothetical protein